MSDTNIHRREALYSLLGDLPDRNRPISAKTLFVEEHDGYVLETLTLDLNGFEHVPAYFARPKDADGNVRRPAILYNHYHGGVYENGKDELIKPKLAVNRPSYAKEITDRGWCALCIDAWNFGERRGRTESELFKEMLWKGQVLWGMMVYDSLRAVDYLVSRPDVDANRIGTTGISMGSTMAWWTAALDDRIAVCVDICCMTDFHALIDARGLDGHGIYYFVPGLLKSFSTSQINELIAPRAHLSLNGNCDKLTPPAGLDIIDAHLKSIYEELGAPEKWRMRRYETGHLETADMRFEVFRFFENWL